MHYMPYHNTPHQSSDAGRARARGDQNSKLMADDQYVHVDEQADVQVRSN